MKTLSLLALCSVLSLGVFAQAGPGHQPAHLKNHPRIDQVNRREDNQEKRITSEKKDGGMTAAQAHQDRTDLKDIDREKHNMRKTDKGHITKTDQKALNQQLNHNSKKIANQ